MSLNKHDELLLKDLRFQPLWLVIGYALIGISCFAVGLYLEHAVSKWICGVSGFLVGMSMEKLVSRRIRLAAQKLVLKKPE